METLDVKKQVDAVFSIANTLRGTYQSDKYKDVIIPMTIIRRLECALAPTKDAVCAQYELDSDTPPQVLCRIAGCMFYNTSRYTLAKLLAQPAQLQKNLKTYLDGFSPNIRQILSKDEGLDFYTQIDKMAKGSRLTGVVRKFAELDLDPGRVSNVAMGYMFEEIIRRFSENAEAGDHYTPREVVRLLVMLGLAEGCDDLREPGRVVKVGDVACGTGGMLATASEVLGELCPEADVYLYGQEVNPESHAICLADMLIKRQGADNIRQADTMKEDCFPHDLMRFEFVNPPFGQPWSGKDAATGVEAAVRCEHAKPKAMSRFPAGLPAGGDMQLLFMQHIVYKLDPKCGRACVISNGSPLFSGGTSSGESQVRRWLLENDCIEAIIGLPGQLFYNTDIAIYVWVLSRAKRRERRGKVQLIDATAKWVPMRRSLGKKRREISAGQIGEIVDAYTAFEESDICRILPAEEFLYHEYAVYQPLQRNYMKIPWVKTGELSHSLLYETEECITTLAVRNCALTIYLAETVLVAMYGQGKTRGMTAKLVTPCTVNQACEALMVNSEWITADFLWWAMIASYEPLRATAQGSGQPNLNSDLIANHKIAIPCIGEQIAIADYLDAKCATIDKALALKREQLGNLRALRQSVIYEYVTGKKRVEVD